MGLRDLDEIDAVFAALAHPARRHIVQVLVARGGTLTAGELSSRFTHSWPTTSRHLGVLLDAGVVSVATVGRQRHYQIERQQLGGVLAIWLRSVGFDLRPANDGAAVDVDRRRSSTPAEHPLAGVLLDAADGRFPAADGSAQFVPPDAWGTCGVVAFSGHAFVLTNRRPDRALRSRADGYGGATDARFLVDLAGPDAAIGSLDVVLARRGGHGDVDGWEPLPPTDAYDDHPRAVRSRQHRRDVQVLGDERGFVTLGAGLLGRTEISIELTAAAHGAGVGRSMINRALGAVADDEAVFAQVAAGNAASLRMFLAAGFVPICSEVLIDPPLAAS